MWRIKSALRRKPTRHSLQLYLVVPCRVWRRLFANSGYCEKLPWSGTNGFGMQLSREAPLDGVWFFVESYGPGRKDRSFGRDALDGPDRASLATSILTLVLGMLIGGVGLSTMIGLTSSSVMSIANSPWNSGGVVGGLECVFKLATGASRSGTATGSGGLAKNWSWDIARSLCSDRTIIRKQIFT